MQADAAALVSDRLAEAVNDLAGSLSSALANLSAAQAEAAADAAQIAVDASLRQAADLNQIIDQLARGNANFPMRQPTPMPRSPRRMAWPQTRRRSGAMFTRLVNEMTARDNEWAHVVQNVMQSCTDTLAAW